jgi:hypothetical protein
LVAQNGFVDVVQHFWPELQATLLVPQQVPSLGAQVAVVPVPQQDWPVPQALLPQQVAVLGAQNGVEPDLLQHCSLAEQPGVLPQQFLPLLIQKGFPFEAVQRTPPSGQCAGLFGVFCARPHRAPNVPRKPPASAPASSFSACRRGVGPARIRAASSTRLATLSGVCDITHLLPFCTSPCIRLYTRCACSAMPLLS